MSYLFQFNLKYKLVERCNYIIALISVTFFFSVTPFHIKINISINTHWQSKVPRDEIMLTFLLVAGERRRKIFHERNRVIVASWESVDHTIWRLDISENIVIYRRRRRRRRWHNGHRPSPPGGDTDRPFCKSVPTFCLHKSGVARAPLARKRWL